MTSTTLKSLTARQILDSRGRPTIEVDAVLSDGSFGRAAVPSGASTGTAEAHELRDGDPAQYDGLGVLKAADHVNTQIFAALAGIDMQDQRGLDTRMVELDGSPQLSRLGANGILGVSLAVCRAVSASLGLPLHRRIADLAGNPAPRLPLPMVNILSGGMHARHGMDVQDFLAIPVSATTIEDAIHMASRVRNAAAAICAADGLPTLLADEGGLSPGYPDGVQALQLMMRAIEAAGLQAGRDVAIAIDVAATELQRADGHYHLDRQGLVLDAVGMTALLAQWARDYPVVSIEDGLGEEDWGGWRTLTKQLGSQVQLVGDDLFATNAQRLESGVQAGAANGILIKLNQNGTLTGTLDTIALARRHGYAPIISARSGETEDPFIADLAVGTGAGQIKIGSLRTSSTVGKYNQLLRISQSDPLPFHGGRELKHPLIKHPMRDAPPGDMDDKGGKP